MSNLNNLLENINILELKKHTGDYEEYDNTSGQPFWGNFTVGCLIISKNDKKILVMHRSKYVNESLQYGTISGKIDNEKEMNLQSEVKREIKEETGYSGNIKLIKAFIFKTKGFEFHNFIGIIENPFKPIYNWESDGHKWLTLEELMKLNNKHFGLKKLLNDSNSLEIIKKYV